MAREVQSDDECVILKLNGVTGLFAFTFNLKMPYSTIKSAMLIIFMLPSGCFGCLELLFQR